MRVTIARLMKKPAPPDGGAGGMVWCTKMDQALRIAQATMAPL
jgi:hypothetical protein